jgi:multidrug efflux pump subunit AcrA (membrane-fusion protein)
MDTASATYSAAQTRLKVAQAQAEQKEAALKVAQLQLSYTKVQAFWEGGDPNRPDAHRHDRVVGERFVDEGTLVSINQPIVSVLENDPLMAVIFVIERDYPKISIGQEAAVTTDAYPGKTFAGAIRRIAPLLRESSRQARVEIEIANADHLLKPGMFVRALVEFGRHDQAALIPISALVRRAGKEGVFIVEGSPLTPVSFQPAENRQPTPDEPAVLQARFVPVTTGVVSGEIVELLEPAVSGMVVTLGNHLLEDRSRVILPKPSPGPDAAKKPGVDARDEAGDEPRSAGDGKKQGGSR